MAIYAPAQTPRPFVDKLSTAIGKAMKDPADIAKLKEAGTDAVGSTPEALDKYWKEQLKIYGEIVKSANVKLESQ